ATRPQDQEPRNKRGSRQMATLIDHKKRSITHGSDENLQEFMITAAMSTPHALRLRYRDARARCATALVRGAIRRGARTDVGQDLRMSDEERQAWESNNPIPT